MSATASMQIYTLDRMASPAPELVAQAVAALGGAMSPSVQSLMRIGVALAQDVNRLPGLKGRERLELVQRILREALAAPSVKDRVPAEVISAIDTIIPEALTLVVSASRGEFSLKRPSVGCLVGVAALFCRGVAAAAGADSQVGRLASQTATLAAESQSAPAPAPATDGTLTVRNPEPVEKQ
jgi:hypothetical protein